MIYKERFQWQKLSYFFCKFKLYFFKENGFVKHRFVINLTGFVITVELIHLEKREDAYEAFFREYNL